MKIYIFIKWANKNSAQLLINLYFNDIYLQSLISIFGLLSGTISVIGLNVPVSDCVPVSFSKGLTRATRFVSMLNQGDRSFQASFFKNSICAHT